MTASITVFVDDAVRADLPPVCASTGRAADGYLPIRRTHLNPWWFLLLLLGPFGIVALLALVLLGDRTEVLVVRLPMTSPAVDAYVARRRELLVLTLGLAGAVVGGAVGAAVLGVDRGAPAGDALFWANVVLIGGILAAMAAQWWRVARTGFGITLDASRRWVQIDGVSPKLAAAVGDQDLTVSR